MSWHRTDYIIGPVWEPYSQTTTLWKCTLCVEYYTGTFDTEAHCASRIHQANLSLLKPPHADEIRWWCEGCHTYFRATANSRANHLSSSSHALALKRSKTQADRVDNVPAPSRRENLTDPTHHVAITPAQAGRAGSPPRSSPPCPAGFWRCEVCDKTMNSNNRESHCTGKAHKAKAAEGRVGSGSSGSAGGGNGGMADRSPLRSKSPLPLAAGSWRCEVCDKTMNSNNRESHCAGKAHKAKDGQAGGRGGGGRGRGGMGGDGREVVEGDNGGGGSSNSGGCSCLIPVWEAHVRRIKWKCIVCEEYMKASATKAHRASRKHRDNLPYASGTQQCKDCLASTEERPESPIYLASSSHGPSSHDSIMRYWAPDSDSGEDDKWVRGGAMHSYRKSMPAAQAQAGGAVSPLGPTPPPLSAKIWRCEVCDRMMDSANRESHCAGKAHKAKAGKDRGRSGRSGGSGGGGGGGSGSGRGGGSGRGRRRKREDSFDSEDGRSLLRDIDTQWGMLPHGGAYKESNFYSSDGYIVG